MVHYEPSHQDPRRLQIQLFSSLVLKEYELTCNFHVILDQKINFDAKKKIALVSFSFDLEIDSFHS